MESSEALEEAKREVEELMEQGVSADVIEELVHGNYEEELWQNTNAGINVAIRNLSQSIGLLLDVVGDMEDERIQQHIIGTLGVYVPQEDLNSLADVFATAAALKKDIQDSNGSAG